MESYSLLEAAPWIKVEMSSWEPLTNDYTPVKYDKGSYIYSQGDPADFVYIISTGRVGFFSVLPNGKAKQFFIGDTGCILGEISCIRQHLYIGSATVMSNCKVYKIPFEHLYRKMQENWQITVMVLNSICRKSGILHYQVMEMSFATPINKTISLLLQLSSNYGELTEDGTLITLRFTHEEVSNLTNTSRTTVSGIFSRLTKEEIITKRGGYYIIKDMNALLKLEKDSIMRLW